MVNSDVIWLAKALKNFRNVFAREIAEDRDFTEKTVTEINEFLMQAFSDAKGIIVIDYMMGYRKHDERHILQVEITREKKPVSAYVIKIDRKDKIDTEINGWESCHKTGGRILMELSDPNVKTKRTDQKMLLYEDATHVIRSSEVLFLEQAVINCCKLGYPKINSVCTVIREIYNELDELFYGQSWQQNPNQSVPIKSESKENKNTDPSQQQKPSQTVADELQKELHKKPILWNELHTSQGKARELVNTILNLDKKRILDPYEYLADTLLNQQKIPQMMRGCAHGDLHGRNVYIGIVDGEAMWPAIFDFEDMSSDNYLAWDFVKMELELKTRVLYQILKGDERNFINKVHKFELELAEETERRNNSGEWDFSIASKEEAGLSPIERLKTIMLVIRGMAKRSLEVKRQRNRRWLEEYYYLLLYYGIYIGRFPNKVDRDFIASYISAGVAASRFAWRRDNWPYMLTQVQSKAHDLIRVGNTEMSDEIRKDFKINYLVPLAFFEVWVRSHEKKFILKAIEELKILFETNYKQMLPLGAELSFANLELGALDPLEPESKTYQLEATKIAQNILQTFEMRHHEVYCRLGRVNKERGDQVLEKNKTEALLFYQQALDFYKEGYEIDKDYFPGINVATLLYLIGNKPQALQVAAEISTQLLALGPKAINEDMWALATLGEVFLLKEEYETSKGHYKKSVSSDKCEPHSKDAMKKQIIRILKAQGKDQKFIDVFNQEIFG